MGLINEYVLIGYIVKMDVHIKRNVRSINLNFTENSLDISGVALPLIRIERYNNSEKDYTTPLNQFGEINKICQNKEQIF